MNSVERIMEIIKKKEIEAVWEEPKAKKNWPSDG